MPPNFRPGQRRSATRGGLTVTLNIAGKSPVTVCKPTAAETLVVVMERLHALIGIAALEKLTSLQVGRGPLLSRNPERDFKNPVNGTVYTNHRLPGTDLYVLTHSSTNEKVENLRAAFVRIGLPGTSFVITKRE